MSLGLVEDCGPVANAVRGDRLPVFLAGRQLYSQIPEGRTLRMADLNRPVGSLLGKPGQQPVAAGASENVDPIELAAEKILQAGERGRVAVGQALEDHPRKDWLISLHVGDCGPAAPPKLVINALGHVGVEQQRLGVNVDRAGESRHRGLCDELFNVPGPSFRAPGLHALLQQPHPVYQRMEAQASAHRSKIGVSRIEGLDRGNWIGDERTN